MFMGSSVKDFKPHGYQSQAIDWILEHEKCGLLLPMGAGKTISTLTAISYLELIDTDHVLIIGPKRVVETTWPDEVAKWSHTQHMSYQLIDAAMAKGKTKLDTSRKVHLVGKENVTALVEAYSRTWPWDMIVIDELSTFKNPRSKRFKALRTIMPRVKRFVGLTGTPAPNGIPDLWSQIYLMDRGERLGRTLGQFRQKYLAPGRRNGYIVYDWQVQEGAEKVIYDKLSDICMSIQTGDLSKLPPLTMINETVELSPKAMTAYRKFQRDKVLELGDDETLLSANAGVLCGQLLQMASGEIYTESATQVIHSAKLEALTGLIESANGQPVMVFYYFKHELERLKRALSKDYRVRELVGSEDVRDWNAGLIDVLLLHPASAGHGLNLQEGGCIAIWYTLPNWNLELYQQANARIYRQGQKRAVTIYHVLAKGTVDQDMLEALEGKDVTQKRLIEALRKGL